MIAQAEASASPARAEAGTRQARGSSPEHCPASPPTDLQERLRDEETDLDSLSEELLGVVRETVQPEHASLWLRSRTADEKEDMPG